MENQGATSPSPSSDQSARPERLRHATGARLVHDLDPRNRSAAPQGSHPSAWIYVVVALGLAALALAGIGLLHAA